MILSEGLLTRKFAQEAQTTLPSRTAAAAAFSMSPTGVAAAAAYQQVAINRKEMITLRGPGFLPLDYTIHSSSPKVADPNMLEPKLSIHSFLYMFRQQNQNVRETCN